MSLQPFFFAWVDGSVTTFDGHLERMDEEIFSLVLKHEEGQIPTLDITIRNPRVGLLNPSRKQWAWLAYQDPNGTVTPIFFGVLVGIPSNLFGELITLQLVGRPLDYIEQKQAFAETLKVEPYWDPIWLDEKTRDDPDSILEGWSSLWHVDRTTLAVTASDILVGEDGTEVFTEDMAFYDSVSMTHGQSPLTNVQVQATVQWTLRNTGYIKGPNVNIQSYTGDTFLGDWPKPGAGLGGGWSVESSFINDVYLVNLTPTVTGGYNWQSKESGGSDGDTESLSESSSFPALLSPNPIQATMKSHNQTGITDPDSDPPINRPATVDSSGIIIPLWVLNGSWTFKYEARRDYTELLILDVFANAQALLTSPLVSQNTEVITLSGANVGEPLREVDAWTDFRSLPVTFGQVIHPNDPTKPGGLSYQICVQPGTAGANEPTFSDVPGFITVDNTVHWASMGETPPTGYPDWSPATEISLGEVRCVLPKTFNVESGSFEVVPNASVFLLCIGSGETRSGIVRFTYVPPALTNESATSEPIIVEFTPGPFDTWPGGRGDVNSDGSVQWFQMGAAPPLLAIPIGGTMANVTARCFFPSDRGKQSVEYLIMKARARLRLRARTVNVSWDTQIQNVLNLSCRKSATIFDPRIPGGQATGKVISYTISADGEGKLLGHVEIGVSVGMGGTVASVPGTPTYANTGYVQDGYQQMTGGTTTISNDEIGYTPLLFAPFDDGLAFPLTALPYASPPIVSGSLDAQRAAILAAIPVEQALENNDLNWLLNQTKGLSGNPNTLQFATGQDRAWLEVEIKQKYTAQSLPYVMEANAISFEMFLLPVTSGPFSGAYFVETTTLELPQGINLSAASSP